jgi:hypothetical protein
MTLPDTLREELVVSQRSSHGEVSVKQLTAQYKKVVEQKESLEKQLQKLEEKLDRLKKNKDEEIRKLKLKLKEDTKQNNIKELEQLKKLINDLNTDKAKMEVRCNSLTALMEKEKLDKTQAEKKLKEAQTELTAEKDENHRLRLRRNYYKKQYTNLKLSIILHVTLRLRF